MLRWRALAGRRFETWDEVTEAVAQATDEWTRTAIPSSGGTAAGTAHPARRASIACQRPHNFPDQAVRLVDRSSSDPIRQRPRADCAEKQDPGGKIGSRGIDGTMPVTEALIYTSHSG